MGWEDNLKSATPLRFLESTNREVGSRMILCHPPEPPPELLMNDPLDSIFIGRTRTMKVPFYWTYANLTNPHIAIVGITGAGKSYLVKSFLTRAALVWKSNALIIDWAGEYVDWVRQAGGEVIELGGRNALNLMDLGGSSPQNRVRQIMRSLEILSSGSLREDESRVIEEALEQAYAEKGFVMHQRGQDDREPPTLKDAHRILKKKAQEAEAVWVREYIMNAARSIGRFTREGADFLSRKSTLEMGKLTSSGLVDIVLKKLPDEEFRVLAGLTILQFLKERMRDEDWSAEKGLKLYVVLDEAWKVAGDERSDAIMIVREGRKYRFGLIVATQNPTDIHEAIFSNVGTTFILNLKFQRFKDYVRNSLRYSDFVADAIERFGVGDAAVNLSFSSKTNFPRTFLLERIQGEDPLVELRLVSGDWKKEYELGALSRMLSMEGFDMDLHAITVEGEVDALALASHLAKRGAGRKKITDTLCVLGMDIGDIKLLFRRMDGNGT